ncbi:hypothetical protein FD35_GL001532 [Furfurilactobacillus rossiae DSM 15814]|uniref:Uncharacterized protein n=1 Tax=Furfurilactobacillus rossiae DSM 15814 TaxID=1114972 RepID=A0A0R1RE36_9LACO|nr:hypothetical protein FD35_GL001532 [Furfurilactobacillus rossiae DSM 15814]
MVPETDQPVQDKIVYRYQTVTKKDLVEYRKVWLQQLFRHPGTYIIATLNGIYRYFDLDTHNGVGFGVTAAYPINIQQNSLRFKNNGTVFKISAFHPTSSLKYILVTMLTIINTVPFLNLFLLGAFYIVLVLLISVNLLFTKDRVNVVVLSPLLIQILVDSVSPVNGSQRYMYPLIFSASIIFFALIKLRKNLATDQDSKDNTLN